MIIFSVSVTGCYGPGCRLAEEILYLAWRRVGDSKGQQEECSQVSWARAAVREGRMGRRQLPGHPGGCSWFCRAQLCSANVPSPHTAWGVLVCNSVNNECEIFIVFTADPCEIISGWVISQTTRARAVCCS